MTRRRQMTDGMIDLLADIVDRRGRSHASLSSDEVNQARGLSARGMVTTFNYANGPHYEATDNGSNYIKELQKT